MDADTAEVYEQQAAEWAAARAPAHLASVEWVNRERIGGPVIDLGCGPGWHLAELDSPSIGLDASAAMLALSRAAAPTPGVPLVQGSADRLPFAAGSLGGALATRVHNHLPAVHNPRALAELHRCLQPGAPVLLELLLDRDAGSESSDEAWATDQRSGEPFAGRLFSVWRESAVADLIEGAGFEVAKHLTAPSGHWLARLRRRFTLPDTVGPGMRMLICGLNPSPYAAESGVGYGRPGNRFWSAALAAGLVTVDRDPYHALDHHGMGMTDLVKRTTRRADELDRSEFEHGLARVERMVRWLQPRVVCLVGLTGWRLAADRTARAGLQPSTLGGRPLYLMPSTSGLNAHARLDDLVDHLTDVIALADSVNPPPLP